MSKKLKNGTVKMVNEESLEVVILGPKAPNGYYREMKVSLHCIQFYENLKSEAFERLRRLLVGKKIKFDDYALGGGKKAADIFLDNKLVSFLMCREGLASSKRSGQKTSPFFEDLEEGVREARKKELGFFKPEETDKKKRKKKKKKKYQTLE